MTTIDPESISHLGILEPELVRKPEEPKKLEEQPQETPPAVRFDA